MLNVRTQTAGACKTVVLCSELFLMSIDPRTSKEEDPGIVLVKEVHPPWYRPVLYISAAVGALATMAGVGYQIFADNSLSRLDPIVRSADRFNRASDGVETWLESMRRARENALEQICGEDGSCLKSPEDSPQEDKKIIDVERVEEPDGTRGYEFTFPWLRNR